MMEVYKHKAILWASLLARPSFALCLDKLGVLGPGVLLSAVIDL